ncbi:MAG: LysM peptidoglycan-binding domain-containing protein [Woeseia sp.]|nr:LysM peptidoglycan-binding domain-containing protein [Woeseia sp.]
MTCNYCQPRLILILFGLLACSGVASASDETFPVPAELEVDVAFWVSVYVDYTTEEGMLHDNRRLSVVYERLPMPSGISRRERLRRIADRRKNYQAILRSLASGKRDGLTPEAERVLALWPADVSNRELAAAARQIRFQQGLSDRFRKSLERAGRWRSHVRNTFARLNVPLEIAALPHVESSYNPAARSHVGASGIWQFTRGTGRRFMRVDHVLDERNDPYAATVAAGELLAYNYSLVGNWPMAITAYNHGLAGVRRAMAQHGDENYVDILRNYKGRTFGFASRNFYVAFVAALRVDQDPERYFPGVIPESPLNYDTVELRDYVPAKAVIDALGISRQDLAEHNLAVQQTVWQGSKYFPKGFELRVPAGRLDAPLADMINNIEEIAWSNEQLPDLFHTVARGDTLSRIAQTYRTRVSTLVSLNNLRSRNRIRIGQRIRLPAAGPAPVLVARSAPSPASVPQPDVAATEVAEEPAATVAAPVATAEAVLADTGILVEPGEADEAIELPVDAQGTLLSDPSDYTVAADQTIEVQPLETLGHYADWLEIRTQRLRDINGFAFRTPLELGKRIKLDMSRVNAAQFENRRTSYQQEQQDAFFREHTIRGVTEHVVRRGESVWVLALRRYNVPLWLFRQYNPKLDLHNVQPGTRVSLPKLADVEG